MTDEPTYACTESPENLPARAQQVRELAAGLLSRQHVGQQVTLRFRPHLGELVDAFVRDESACCEFFDFAVTRDAQAVQLTVWAPAGAQQLLASLHSVFGGGRAGSDEAMIPGR